MKKILIIMCLVAVLFSLSVNAFAVDGMDSPIDLEITASGVEIDEDIENNIINLSTETEEEEPRSMITGIIVAASGTIFLAIFQAYMKNKKGK